MEDFQVNGLVAVDNPVPQRERLLPGYAWELVFDASGGVMTGQAGPVLGCARFSSMTRPPTVVTAGRVVGFCGFRPA